ncbi:MAG: alpha-amylase, partial [Flavobacteriaceae bacterium]
SENAGYGTPSRTSIFDYIGVPAHQRWMNNGAFNGGLSTPEERELRDFYKRLLNFTITSGALMGKYRETHYYNKQYTDSYDHRIFSFVRWSEKERLIIISNFDAEKSFDIDFKLPPELIREWGLNEGKYPLEEQLYGKHSPLLNVTEGEGRVKVLLKPLESHIYGIRK